MSAALPSTLRCALSELAGTDRLLVASDFDGTLAPLVARPSDARPLPEAAAALVAASSLPATAAALISGRARDELAALARLPPEVILVGSHGSEFDDGFGDAVDDDARALLSRIVDELGAIAARHRGVTVEIKPVSAALHVRNADPADGSRALAEAEKAARGWDGAQTTTGKAVVEFAVVATDKGQALDILRERHRATGAVFFGDDVTDENAFRRLRRGDVGVKVGDGDTAAAYRVADAAGVAAALQWLTDRRRG